MLVPWLRKIWENTDICYEQYHCATVLFILSFILYELNVIIDCAIYDPGHGKYVVYGLNAANYSTAEGSVSLEK